MSSHILQWGILRLLLPVSAVHRPTKVLCPRADFARGSNKMEEGVAQKLNIFPCPLCLLFFCFPQAAFSVLSSAGLCFPTLTSSPLGCQSSLLASLQETLTTTEVSEMSPKIHIFLSSLQSLPALPRHSLMGHSPALPGPPPSSFGTCSPVRSSVSRPFLGVHLRQPWCFLHFTHSPDPSPLCAPGPTLLGSPQLFAPTAASLLCLAR